MSAITDFLSRLNFPGVSRPQISDLPADDLVCLSDCEISKVVRMMRNNRRPQTSEEKAAALHLWAHSEYCGFCPQRIEDLLENC